MQKSSACLDEHWDVGFESSEGRMLLEQEEELCPGKEDEKSSQVSRSVTVDQTEPQKNYVSRSSLQTWLEQIEERLSREEL